MDLYLINGHDGISLPEMIDWDIKLSNPEINEDVDVDSLMGLGYELPSLDIEDEPGSIWAHSYSVNSNSSFELDLLGEGGSAIMVNPGTVMPFVSTLGESKVTEEGDEISETKSDLPLLLPADSEKIKKESPDLKLCKSVVEEVTEDITEPKDELNTKLKSTEHIYKIKNEPIESIKNVEPAEQAHKVKSLKLEFVDIGSADKSVFEIATSKKGLPSQKKLVVSTCDNLKAYPKPPYSYSCLIAMALKNSHKGSLPVSEIYSFMCHHFPYFKTAPSGWKNSVRHNLSLNKCFEKIEKPSASGASSSQRKGCLWAMNPSKITKMDDEVAKWTKKDPAAIKNAMVFPDNLELLERGELKDDAAFDVLYTEEDSDEVREEEIEDEFGTDTEDERISPIDDDSEDEMSRIPPSLKPFEPKCHFNSLMKSRIISDKSRGISVQKELKVREEYDKKNNSTRNILNLDQSTPMYAVDPRNENLLIELPIVKRPRVQGSYLYQPVLNIKRHNAFRSVKVESP